MSYFRILDIPIYRCTVEAFEKENQREVKREIDASLARRLEPFAEEYARKVAEREEGRFDRNVRYTWYYNEIVGWVTLYSLQPEIVADLFWIDAKRIRRDRGRKPFKLLHDRWFTVMPHYEQTAEEIHDVIRDRIVKFSKMNGFRGRYFDLGVFDALGPHIDWHGLLGLSPQKPPRSSVADILARLESD